MSFAGSFGKVGRGESDADFWFRVASKTARRDFLYLAKLRARVCRRKRLAKVRWVVADKVGAEIAAEVVAEMGGRVPVLDPRCRPWPGSLTAP